MFCKNCGTDNSDESKYCKKCGESLTSEKIEVKTNKKSLYYIAGGVVVALALIIAVIIGVRGKKAKEYEQYLETAEKYIEELDFEQAKDFYLQAIRIAPKELEPYARLAQLYVDEGDVENAEFILQSAVNEGAKGTSEVEEAIEKVRKEVEELKNGISYDWIVEPEIEADDIYYVKYESENMEDPVNITKRQTIEPYAVIQKDDALGLIGMDGHLVLEMKYKNVQQYFGQYLLKSIEPEYYADFDMEWDMFSWDETYGLTIADGFGGGSQGEFYYCNGLYNIEEDNEMFEVYVPEEAMPVLLTEEIYGGYDRTGMWQYEWRENQEEKYGVYYQGQLVDDGTYDEYGSESDGLLAVSKDGKWGYINQNGDVVIPVEYDASWDKYNEGDDLGVSTYEEFCYAASDGYIVLRKGDQWELRDVTGKVAIPAGEFEAIRPVYEGKCWVKQEGKWGVIVLIREETEENAEKTGGLEKQELRENIENVAEREILYFAGEDFDGDGFQEAYALVATDTNDNTDEITCAGEIWFADENVTKKMFDDMIYYIEPHILDFGTSKYWVISEYYTTSGLDYVWGIEDNSPEQASISGMYSDIQQIENTNECTFQHSTYDAMSDGTGHTYKQYYLYWDGTFHEYGGLSISEEQLGQIAGGSDIISEIKSQGYYISDIFYRENGIININYQDMDINCNATLLLEDDTVSLLKTYSMEKTDNLEESNYSGVYASALYPELATYPDGV